MRRSLLFGLDAAVLRVPAGRSCALGARHHQRPSSWRGEEGKKEEDGEEEGNSLRAF